MGKVQRLCTKQLTTKVYVEDIVQTTTVSDWYEKSYVVRKSVAQEDYGFESRLTHQFNLRRTL